MGTRRALAKRFSLCLTRKRQSWGACDSLFPLPVEEKDFPGTLQGSVAGVRTELCRAPWLGCAWSSAGLRGWGAHGAPQGPEGLRGALQGFVAWNCLSFDRQGETAITSTLGRFEHFEAAGGAFSSTGRGKRVGAPQNNIPPLAPTF